MMHEIAPSPGFAQGRRGAFARWRSRAYEALLAIGMAAALVFAMMATGVAQTQSDLGASKPQVTPPLPPARPADLNGHRPAAPPPAPTPSPVAAPPSAPSAPAPNVIAAPRNLPAASRERMHACGLEWQEMKASGAATDRNWRDFAQVCLAR